MADKKHQIQCSACGADSWVKREPVYDENFKKTGEKLSCAACGHVFASEAEVPYKDRSGPKVFSDSDKPKALHLFADDEKGRNCRHCEHYVVNPFTQRCGLHFKKVLATDICDDFAPVKTKEDKPK